ncbi:PKD domain-containing protein [Candidatus Bathyarchaeota archaeon]|nr:MAG: PKD domain-containing protein [Candidatus Bathyarchaeota archaeon]
MKARLLVVLLILGIIAVPILPRAHAVTGTNFDNIVVVAMENQNYASVMGSGTGSSNAPFIASMLAMGATVPLYHGYGAAGRTVNGCSAGCYTALISGNDQGVFNGYGCCINAPTLIDSMTAAGLTWNAFCQNGCPRGNDHFPFTGFAGTANSPNIMGSSCCSGQPDPEFVAPMNSASPPNFIWLTPTDGNNMHDNSIQTGDSYLHDLLVGPSGSIGSPAAGSVLASNLFAPGHRTMLLVWWDEYDPAPIMFYRPGLVKEALISASDVYDEYSVLHLIENNWGLPTLTANDAAASPIAEIFGSSIPLRLATSFTVSPSTPLANVPVSFTATTTGGATPYMISWNFGDGSSGTGASILHTFQNAQSFTITETATDSSSPSQTATSSNAVTVSRPPPSSTSFAFLPSTPIVNSPVTFTSTTTGGTAPYAISWNFGDGAVGTGATTTHTYTTAQSYTVTETATDSSSPSQTATSSKTVTVTTPPPLSTSFTFQPANPVVNTLVTFTAATTGGTSPYTTKWNFGDGTTGTGASITHVYSSAQSFSVTETATDTSSPSQNAVSSQTIAVSPPPPPSISFTFLPATPIVNSPVTFTATTIGGTPPYSVTWNFGDGTSGTGTSVTHTFTSAQSFTVKETATDASTPTQTATSSQSVTVVTTPPLSTSLQVSSSSPQVGQTVTFTASATGGTSPYTYTITFGDGATGTGSVTIHAYSIAGSYTAKVTVTDSASPRASVATSVIVNVQALVPLALAVPGNQTVVAGTWINFTITAASANIGGAVSLSAAGLPAGSSFSHAAGLFSWKPSASQTGSYTIVFTATDSSYPSAPTSKSTGIQVNQAVPGGSNGGNGGSGGGSNGSCTLCGLFPKISTNTGLFVVGGLLGLISTLAVLTIRAGTSLERTKRRINRMNY